jgi:hypothetical protein
VNDVRGSGRDVRGPFEKFVDSPYYFESELCGGAVTVSFWSNSLGKRCTSYNAPPTSQKRAADRWLPRNFLPWSSLFMFGKAQKSHGVRSGLYGGCSNGVPPIHFFQAEHRNQFIFRYMRFLSFSNHEKGAPRHEISKWWTVCSTFSRNGWSVVRVHSLTMEVLRKRDRHRTSTKLRLGEGESTNFANGPHIFRHYFIICLEGLLNPKLNLTTADLRT